MADQDRDIDRPLVIGSVLFGAGWGLVGLCPGPALENLATLSPRVIVFVVAMAAGMMLHDVWQSRRLSMRREGAVAAVTDGCTFPMALPTTHNPGS